MKKVLFGLAVAAMLFTTVSIQTVKASTLPDKTWQVYHPMQNLLIVFNGDNDQTGICYSGKGKAETTTPWLEVLYHGQCTR
jgi:hypothetical protein